MGNPFSVPNNHETPPTKYFTDFITKLPRMEGKTVAITGCTSGTGFILAKLCAHLGATVLMVNRPSERADKALRDVSAIPGSKVALIPCDLNRFVSVREAAKKLQDACPDGLDVLCNNAGVMGLLDEATPDGFDVQMQCNHLSHFLLVADVFPLLEKAAAKRGEARIVNHSSGARLNAKGLLPQYLGPNGGNLGGYGFPGMGKWHRYCQSKLANLMYTYALHDKIQEAHPGSKVKVLCAHPGPTDSGLQRKTAGDRLLDLYILSSTIKKSHSVEDGTMGIARCCCEPNLDSLSFYGPPVGITGPAVLLPSERNRESEFILWEESMKALRHFGLVNYFS